MKKNESNSALTKRLSSVKLACSKSTPVKRQSSANHRISSVFKKQSASSTKTLSSTRASTTSRVNLTTSSKSSGKLKENQDNSYLLNTLKTYIMKSSRDLNLIQREIPKFTARKIQDLKKGYKFNENFDALASCFLAVFGEIDEELKKEMISLRMKIGEHLVNYFSNSGKFIKILKNLTDVFRKVDIGTKALFDAGKMLEIVKREKLSTNYQDLYDFMLAIIRFFRGKKSNSKLIGEGNQSFMSNRMTPDRLFSTQSIINQSTEISFFDNSNPLSCSNKSSSSTSIFRRSNNSKTPKELSKCHESLRCSSHNSLSKRLARLDESKASDVENSVCISRDHQSIEKRKEWDEIRTVRVI
jgi:hypothetical protein